METRMREAALLIGNLVPNCIKNGTVSEVSHADFMRLGTGERAAYEIALDLWTGGGTLARFLSYADQRYAGVMIAALTVAAGGVLVPLEEDVRRIAPE